VQHVAPHQHQVARLEPLDGRTNIGRAGSRPNPNQLLIGMEMPKKVKSRLAVLGRQERAPLGCNQGHEAMLAAGCSDNGLRAFPC
jgi:hypothetical protein